MGYFVVDLREYFIDHRAEGFEVGVVGGFEPMVFALFPQHFDQVEMRTVRRQEPDVQPGGFPSLEFGLDASTAVQNRVVQQQNGRTHQKRQKILFDGVVFQK